MVNALLNVAFKGLQKIILPVQLYINMFKNAGTVQGLSLPSSKQPWRVEPMKGLKDSEGFYFATSDEPMLELKTINEKIMYAQGLLPEGGLEPLPAKVLAHLGSYCQLDGHCWLETRSLLQKGSNA
ncbi:hypothetical protein M422DRAFT_273084 [Sphaerobolus stellatus SS14]|uniref:Unplaced genomic scaffold SPHSTscaffold_318, whole genome shotgun sequence n=1 Tax=Sphaerobolus stellatus (strain SS14) TaxID=990650 RepID=A0A0C9UA03_SPHS4|nr:hypothetical protein M422DRAFT_273084 [Sphaerobolus stellatus SS14]